MVWGLVARLHRCQAVGPDVSSSTAANEVAESLVQNIGRARYQRRLTGGELQPKHAMTQHHFAILYGGTLWESKMHALQDCCFHLE